MKIIRKVLFLLSTLFLNLLPGQEVGLDSVYELSNVVIVDYRAAAFNTGYKVDKIETAVLEDFRSASLADMLRASSNLNIKSYGPGGLSGFSLRGSSSYHSAVLWNGINLQSPMNGGFNLSTLPVDFISDASIQYGSSGALAGSGAAFGLVRLNSLGEFKREAKSFVSTSLSSFSNYRVAAGSEFSVYNSLFSVKAYYQIAENDFEFVNTSKFGNPKERQSNAGLNQYAFLIDNKSSVIENIEFSSSLMYQKYNKEVQGRMSDYNASEAFQEDENIILTTLFAYDKESLNINLRNAYMRNRIDYSDPNSAEPYSVNFSDSFVSELEANYAGSNKKDNFHFALNNSFEKANSSAYDIRPSRNRLALIAAYKRLGLFNVLNSSIGLRKEFVESKNTPLQLSLGLNSIFSEYFTIKYNIGRIYRVPTLNDLYWVESAFAVGNPDLKDESGWNNDFGLSERFETGLYSFEFSQNIFYNYIDNLIVWMPDSSGKWKPFNADAGRSNGFELGMNIVLSSELGKLSFKNDYTYVDSRVTDDDGQSWSKQIYVPKHSVNSVLGYSYKSLSMSFIFNYYSERFIDKSENYLDGYTIGDVNIGYMLPLGFGDLNLGFNANNIWNTQYQLSADYAMPLANYSLTAKLIIK